MNNQSYVIISHLWFSLKTRVMHNLSNSYAPQLAQTRINSRYYDWLGLYLFQIITKSVQLSNEYIAEKNMNKNTVTGGL